MDPITLLGLAAALLTSIAFVPQVVRNFRRKHVADLSWSTFGTFTVGVMLWLAYGIAIGSLPIILANIFTLAVSMLNLGQMWAYRARPAD
ncbi:SemiSWEET transporter [Silanimonas sp.]|uniref:SemiSWEET family sugar transporter n=1 Tax=Silanimonas sp. TaxID=1929290 RepID=UPI001BC1275C|nr:SemiSWEET transporter [Silanimonas sp.]MBS3896583.1 SemiSWEET transporter [Silanimonas sp.]MBS3924717.1 SemiSWEET transporter [Xanthomonadaceae bacterium]